MPERGLQLWAADLQVTVGEEGFFAQGDPAIAGNPSGGWAGKTGQDFRNNHVSPVFQISWQS